MAYRLVVVYAAVAVAAATSVCIDVDGEPFSPSQAFSLLANDELRASNADTVSNTLKGMTEDRLHS